VHTKNKAEKTLATNPFNIATQHRCHRNRHTPARLRPLAAALILALNGTPMSALPTLGAIAAGSMLIATPRDAHAACTPSTPAKTSWGTVTEISCSGNLSAGISSATTAVQAFADMTKTTPPTTILTVANPSANIMPSANVPGILLSMKGGVLFADFDADPFILEFPSTGGVLDLDVSPLVNISTQGTSAHGIHVKSQGSVGTDGDSSWTNTNGAPGGSGYAGGAVKVNTCTADAQGGCVASATSQSQINTHGSHAHGLFVESLGANGGKGESIGPAVSATGGNGGAAGAGGLVTVDNTANISTEGDLAYGIFAQSIGGDGGNGGGVAAALSAAFGEGGNGGKGGNVTVTNSGNINTLDSITNPYVNVPEYKSVDVPLIGVINVLTGNYIKTLGPDGDGSHGIYARSRGGSAGDAGDANGIFSGGSLANLISKLQGRAEVSSAGNVTINNSGAITASGNQSRALFAESLGGDGGAGGTAGGIFAFGGRGSAAGHGGVVAVNNTGKLKTDGDNASAVLAESIGGGGGNGGGALGIGLGISLAIGGGAEDGGNGGAVTVISDADANLGTTDIATLGDYSNGIEARSIGGGGGTGGYATSLTAGVPVYGVSVGISVAIGGSGAVGGGADIVKVDNASSITTQGRISHGIFAESTGGGGGSGGASTAFTASGGGSVNLSAAVSVGGSGGGGGNSANVRAVDGTTRLLDSDGSLLGSVKVLNSGDITTGNAGKHAVTVSQLSGVSSALIAALQAHDSAITIAQLDQLTKEELLEIEGIDATAADDIAKAARLFMRQDEQSHGIYARGIGGGGGDGGLSIAGTLTVGQGAGVAVAVGGSGDGGGKGGAVFLVNQGDITTYGEKSHAIVGQSIGGGGGDGGASIAGTLAFGGASNTASVAVSVGGGGGGGGVAEEVLVANFGTLKTNSIGSYGVLAQSIGGGGGNGGLSVAGSLSVSSGKSASVDISVGGSGGAGNAGGAVKVFNIGNIETFADQSHAVFAQSVGGKGGTGGTSVAAAGAYGGDNLNVTVGVGGTGGEGGIGGEVLVSNQKNINTHGDLSSGVFAQSIGGGGGTGGASVAGSATFFKGTAQNAKNVNLGFSVGGKGGKGNEGGTVTVTNNGEIITTGIVSHGIFAESVGGGGGQGGLARTFSLITNGCQVKSKLTSVAAFLKIPGIKAPAQKCPADTSGSFNLGVGGKGGTAGHGGLVEVTNTKNIVTIGISSHGIFAQSIGGGGGTGGEGADGVGFPLIGLDSPKKTNNVSLSIGGSSGASGDGRKVLVNHLSGKITTLDMGSFGVYAQSVGGGGGQGGHGASGLIGLSIGGSGGAAGNGGAVEVNLGSESTTSTIETSGIFAHGVYAQSVGGGGGLGGTIAKGPSGLIDTNVGGITLHGGNAGSGNEVTVTSFGNITTGALVSEGFEASGFASMGVYAQSVGGGGGLAGGGLNNFAVLSGSAGGHGSGGDVTVHHTGNITTNGAFSHAIYAQSEGGSASFDSVKDALTISLASLESSAVALSELILYAIYPELFESLKLGELTAYQLDTLVGGDIEVVTDGNIVANGIASLGIHAQSKGKDSNGNIKVNVKGLVQGGSGPLSAGINIQDGANNVVTIGESGKDSGAVTTVDGVFGVAILGGLGKETVNNHGTVTGSVNLGAGANAFNNLAGGRLVSGATVNLGTGNTLKNDGSLSPGGVDQTLITAVTGNLVQSQSGEYVTDLDFLTNLADRVDVSGTSSLGGKISVNLVNPSFVTPGSKTFTILSSAGGVTDKTNLALSAEASAVIKYALLYPNSTDVVLERSVNFAPVGGAILSRNQSAIGVHINAIQQAGGSPEFAPITAYLISLPDAESLGRVYDELSSEPLLATTTTAVLSDLRFSDALHSCRVREGEFRFVSEGECSWVRLIGSKLDQDRTASNLGFDRKTNTLAAGAQKRVNQNWSAGFGFSIDTSTLHVADSTRSEGNQYALGVITKRNLGADAFTASLNLGYGPYDTTRLVNLTGPVVASSRQKVGLASVHMRWSRDYEHKKVWYLRPLLDVGVTHVYHGAFDEQGAGAANLSAKSGRDTLVSLQPGLEFGREFATAGGTLIRPFGMVGLTHFVSGATTGVTASLQGAPVGTAPFTTESTMDKTYADLTLGMDTLSTSGSVFRISYTGQYSEHTESHSASLKVAVPF